jgi:hypothetical protein
MGMYLEIGSLKKVIKVKKKRVTYEGPKAICNPRREASGENKSNNTLLLDLWLQNYEKIIVWF